MYGTFLGLNTSLRGLLAQQASLDTTAHNITNINTEGYSRQRADLATTTPLSVPAWNALMPGHVGTGVEVTGFSRLRDAYLDRTLRAEGSRFGSAGTSLGSLQQVEASFAEPSDYGISAQMQRFFAALDGVAAHPDSVPARQAFAQMADALATGFNQLDGELTAISTQSDDRLNNAVNEINSLSGQIAALNTTIRDSVQSGQDPNDFRDARDKLMDQLASKLNYTYTTNPATEEVTITLGTTIPINLVDPLVPGGSTPITRADLDTAYGNGDLTAGETFGDEDMFTTVIPFYRNRLDDLVDSLVTQVNAQNAAGFDLAGIAGGDIFDAAGITAGTMRLDVLNNILANPNLIAAASSWLAPGEPGNGNNANALLAMRSVVQGPPLNATWESFYTATVADLGTRTDQAGRDVSNQGALVESLEGRKASVSGVSLDEEMSNMLRFQHAYNASARVLTAFDEALDTLINRMGRVGL